MHIERLFSAGTLKPQDSTRFVRAGSADAPLSPALLVPDSWSLEAAEAFTPALCQAKPAQRRAIEENTTPSWLWSHAATVAETEAETSVMDVFARVAASATLLGWKNGLWDDEVMASRFHDELIALLLARKIVLPPAKLSTLGLDWAYGIAASPKDNDQLSAVPTTETLILQNDTIDSILRRNQPTAENKWRAFLETSLTKPVVEIAFADTMAEWASSGASPQDAPEAVLNMLAFRTEEGEIDTAGIEQAAKIVTLFLDLHYESLSAKDGSRQRALAIGFANMSALLMSLAIPYDSEKGRATAAALAALITATATATSARLAERLGTFPAFSAEREPCLRNLRNRLRASFAERNDYEHLSVLPKGIEIESGADLVLIAKARYALEEAHTLAQIHGLRHRQVTRLFDTSMLAPLLDSTTSGSAPETTLTCSYALGDEQFERRIRPSFVKGLEKLGYDEADRTAIVDHVAGYKTLKAAPGLSLASLHEKGLTKEILSRIESVLPFVPHIRYAFTPWVLGTDFCQQTLGLTQTDIENPRLDLLRWMGFTSTEIETANRFCCGHGTASGISELAPAHLSIFPTLSALTAEAQLRMAGAIQAFISGDMPVDISIPSSLTAELRGNIIIQAWELGLRNIRLTAEGYYKDLAVIQNEAKLMKRQTLSRATGFKLAPASSQRALKHKAALRSVSLAQAAAPAHTRHGGKRGK